MKKVFSLLFVFALILAANVLATSYSVTLKPNSDSLSQWESQGTDGGIYDFSYVNENPSDWNTEDANIQSNISGQLDSFGVQDISSNPESINSVTVKAIATGNHYYNVPVTGTEMKLILITHGTTYYRSAESLLWPNTRLISASWTVNPYTSNPWTKAEINNMQIGVMSISGASMVFTEWADVVVTT